jgi:hypothetical protein
MSVPQSEEYDYTLIEKNLSKKMLSEDDQESMHPTLRSLYQIIQAQLNIGKDLMAIENGKYYGTGLMKVYVNMLNSMLEIRRDKVFSKSGRKQKKRALILYVNEILNFEELPQEPIPELDSRLKSLFEQNIVIAPVIFDSKERK